LGSVCARTASEVKLSKFWRKNLSPHNPTFSKGYYLQQNENNPSTSLQGPDRPTLIERLILSFHIHYILGCLILATLVGPPGAVLLIYAQTSDRSEAVSKTVFLFLGVELQHWQGIVALILLYAVLFYCPYLIRFMRLNLVSKKSKLVALLPEGEADYHKVFGPVSQRLPPIAMGVVLIVLVSLDSIQGYVKFGIAIPNLLFFTICSFIWVLIAGTFVWVYFASIRGLYELGNMPLKLKHHHDDRMLGVGPIGELSLSFTFAYLAGPGAFVLLTLILFPGASTPLFTSILIFLIISGISFFFLPLYSTHQRMVEEKVKEEDSLRQQIDSKMASNKPTKSEDPALSKLIEELSHQNIMLKADMDRKNIQDMPTWPIDSPIWKQFAAMIITITCTLLANLLMNKWNPWTV
jgi:hypothetical protein